MQTKLMELGANMYQRLHKVRSDRGLSQTELANKSGVSQSVISKIERGAMASPGADNLTKLAATLGCSVADFINDRQEPEDRPSPVVPVSGPKTADLPFIFDLAIKPSRFTDNPLKVLKGSTSEVMIGRPPFLEGLVNAYAVRQHGDEMVPRYKPSEIIYVAPECDANVIVVVDDKNEGSYGFVRELVTINGDGSIVLRQHNPPQEILVPADVLQKIDLVVGSRRRLNA